MPDVEVVRVQGALAVVEDDAVLEVAMVDVVVIGLPMTRKPHKKSWVQGTPWVWWRIGEGAVDEDGDAVEAIVEGGGRCRNRRSRAAIGDACAGFARLGNTSGTKARAGVANTGHTREKAPIIHQRLGDQQRRTRRWSQFAERRGRRCRCRSQLSEWTK